MKKIILCALLFVAFLFQGGILFAQQSDLTVDHRYSPPWWQTLICMPDDPVKTLVGREGQLFGDYGYGGPRNFSFAIRMDGEQPEAWKSQTLLSAKAPITRTVKTAGDLTITEEAFLQLPEPEKINSIVRFDSRKTIRNWSKPAVSCDTAFNDIAYGEVGLSGAGELEFHVRVQPGSAYTIALGFCEGELDTAGQRMMRVQVEGAAQRDIVPFNDFGIHRPGVYFFEASDANRDGLLTIVLNNMPGAKNRNAYINGIWCFKGKAPAGADIIAGKANAAAALYAPCVNIPMPARRYHMLVKIKNNGATPAAYHPVIRYQGVEELVASGSDLKIGDETIVSTSAGAGQLQQDSAGSYHVAFPAMRLNAGEQREITLTLSRFFGPANKYHSTTEETSKQENRAFSWWTQNCPSATAISIPDSGIQSMVESCIRNIFQARDVRNGAPAFHVGPTIYRGLWLADGSFLLEVATMLGLIKDTRSCIETLTHYQLPDGGFEMIEAFHKENAFVPFMLIRHAMLTNDTAWLEQQWVVVEGCIRRIQYLRTEAMEDSSKPYFGLLPAGFVDGGLEMGNDYSNTEWCLSGMKWAISAAHWLGKEGEAANWQQAYDDFFTAFLTKARSDLHSDDKGNTYLPVTIHNEGNLPPQKGQWSFCQSVYPGMLFDSTAETRQIAIGTMDMLRDHREEGIVLNTGWMRQGLWTYFSSFYGHALLWLGKTAEVPQVLYDFANHSSPTLDWREEQKPQGKGYSEIGDMPHNWASAEFIRLVVHMIEIDKGGDLHLFEGLPTQWLQPGKQVALHGIRTPFGPVDLSLIVNSTGDAAELKLQFTEPGHLPGKVVVHKENWTAGGGVVEVAGAAAMEMAIQLK
jgi:hypothetical protein